MNNSISTVISVCAIKDIETWETTSQYVVKNIIAKRYVLLVPDDQVEMFKARSDEAYEVLPESDLVGDIVDLLKSSLYENTKWRFGWYLQQFIKLAAVEKYSDDGITLIWDADTVPLKKLNFVTADGKIVHYRGGFQHAAYFINIKNLLNIEPQVEYSFIAQCIAMRGQWAQSFFKHISELHGCDWKQAIIGSIDFNEASGFSEYEVLGNYFLTEYKDECILSNRTWSHSGRALIGNVANLEAPRLANKLTEFDFVAFEHWDTRSHRIEKKLNKILRKLKRWYFKYLRNEI